MLNYKDCIELIDSKINELTYKADPSELYNPIKYILSLGGKRLRPSLSFMSHYMYSEEIASIINPALGIEVFHNFTLLHDDIMDKAPLRRNNPTVHKKWNENVAILSGDAMMILAYDLISRTSREFLPDVFALFNKTALEVCEGQQYDMNFEIQQEVTLNEYVNMIRLKTGVLIGAALAIGAITSRAPEGDIKLLYDLGVNVGIAFQLQDDYLDVFADQHMFGKSIGGDILSNKKTYLLIKALSSPNKQLVNQLIEWIDKKDFDPDEKISAVTAIYQKLNIGDDVQMMADMYFKKGIECLKWVNVEKDRKDNLLELIKKTMIREK